MQTFIEYWAFFVSMGILFVFYGAICYQIHKQSKEEGQH